MKVAKESKDKDKALEQVLADIQKQFGDGAIMRLGTEEHIEIEPDEDFNGERKAIEKALSSFKELALDGIMLINNDTIIAVTIGSKVSDTMFDVHYEKALFTQNGTYTAINNEFAKYIRKKYPSILFIDREEDMGDPGLRKAKQSYYPHHMIQVWRAILKEN